MVGILALDMGADMKKNNIKAVMLSSDNENIILIYSDGEYKNIPVEHVEKIIIEIERSGHA